MADDAATLTNAWTAIPQTLVPRPLQRHGASLCTAPPQPAYLFHEEQSDPLKHLVPVECRDGHVEEKAVQHRRGDVGEGVRQQEDGQADQDVGEEAREARLSDLDDAAGGWLSVLERSVPLSRVLFAGNFPVIDPLHW